MRVKFYCDLHVSECFGKKPEKIMKKLRKNKLQPEVYIISLARGGGNQLEFFSSLLLTQHVYDNADILVVGIADGYTDALYMVEQIVDHIYQETKETDIRRFILRRQAEYESMERKY